MSKQIDILPMWMEIKIGYKQQSMAREARSKLKLGILVVAVLGRASAGCPAGWSAGPASKCYRLTERGSWSQ